MYDNVTVEVLLRQLHERNVFYFCFCLLVPVTYDSFIAIPKSVSTGLP
jgi:hypothetical protein